MDNLKIWTVFTKLDNTYLTMIHPNELPVSVKIALNVLADYTSHSEHVIIVKDDKTVETAYRAIYDPKIFQRTFTIQDSE